MLGMASRKRLCWAYVMIQATATDQHMCVTALGLSTCTSISAETQDKDKEVVVGVKDQE